jgi:predicted methyltransferase
MKIELTYDGKNYFDPVFKFFWNNEKDKFAIGICYSNIQNYDFIIADIDNNFEKYENNAEKLFYYTHINVYVFNLNEFFKLLPKNKIFEHSIVLLDKNDKIIENNYRVFEAILNENSNQ